MKIPSNVITSWTNVLRSICLQVGYYREFTPNGCDEIEWGLVGGPVWKLMVDLEVLIFSSFRVVGHHPYQGQELWRHSLLLQFLVHELRNILWQNLHQSLGCKFPHAVILDWSSR